MNGSVPMWLRIVDLLDRGFSHAFLSGTRFLRHLFYFSFLGDRGFQSLTDLFYFRRPTYSADGHNRRGFMQWESEVVDRYFSEAHRILVTSCGGGREVLAFAERGCEVVGTECHSGLATIAEHLCGSFSGVRIFRNPPTELPSESGMFDAVVLGWGGYTHLAPRSRRVAFLRELGRALRPGGPLLISYLGRNPGGDRSIAPALGIANAFRRITRRRTLEPGDTILLGFCHRFLPGEASDEATEAGLEIVLEATAPPGLVGGQYPHLVARRRE